FCGFFFQAEDGIRDFHVTGVQTCALPIFFTLKDKRAEAERVLAERRERQAREREAATGKARKNARSAEDRNFAGLDKLFAAIDRSEERRVGNGCRYRSAPREGKSDEKKRA